MGLDGVELIMAVEEKFHIEISDFEAEQCTTVEKLVDAVLPKLRQSSAEPCPSQQGFYRIRRILTDKLELKRTQIKLNTKVDDIIEQTQRHEMWCSLMDIDPSVARPLVRPFWLSLLVFWLIPLLVCAGIVTCGWLPVGLAIMVSIGIAVIGAKLTTSFKAEFPHNVVEVRDLIRFVAPLDSRVWTKEDVFLKIREITAEQFGVEESEVTLETDFVKELGC